MANWFCLFIFAINIQAYIPYVRPKNLRGMYSVYIIDNALNLYDAKKLKNLKDLMYIPTFVFISVYLGLNTYFIKQRVKLIAKKLIIFFKNMKVIHKAPFNRM